MARPKKGPIPFTKIFNSLMKERGLIIAEAAKIAQVPQSTLGDWLSGTQPDDYVALKRLSDHFNVTLAFLLTGEEDKAGKAGTPPISSVFDDGGALFEGFAEISIRRLVPRGEKKKIGDTKD